jgi:hypothetical protein
MIGATNAEGLQKGIICTGQFDGEFELFVCGVFDHLCGYCPVRPVSLAAPGAAGQQATQARNSIERYTRRRAQPAKTCDYVLPLGSLAGAFAVLMRSDDYTNAETRNGWLGNVPAHKQGSLPVVTATHGPSISANGAFRIGGAWRAGRGRVSVHDQSLLQPTVAELSFSGHLLN